MNNAPPATAPSSSRQRHPDASSTARAGRQFVGRQRLSAIPRPINGGGPPRFSPTARPKPKRAPAGLTIEFNGHPHPAVGNEPPPSTTARAPPPTPTPRAP